MGIYHEQGIGRNVNVEQASQPTYIGSKKCVWSKVRCEPSFALLPTLLIGFG